MKRAEAVCKLSVRETEALRENLPRVFSNSSSPQEAITNGIVLAGLKIISSESARLRNLDPRPSSPALETFLGLFEPIVELGRQRLQVGREGNAGRAHDLELMIVSLGDEQSAAARRFGLRTCSIDFFSALGGLG